MRWFLATIALAAALACGFLALAGWFGGAVFASYEPTRATPTPRAAIYLSGDVGPSLGLGSDVVSTLRANGYAVVTVNSAAYFNRRRDPAEITRLVSEALDSAAKLGGTGEVVAVGHSFGADMLHVALARMPAAARARVARVIYIAPSSDVEFAVSPLEMLGLTSAESKAIDTARQVSFAPVACIYGKDDSQSLCPHLTWPGTLRLPLPGGHNLRFDGDALDRALVQALVINLTQSSSAAHRDAGL